MTDEIQVHKFIVEISVYPNGGVYHKMYPIGSARKGFAKKKEKVKAEFADPNDIGQKRLI